MSQVQLSLGQFGFVPSAKVFSKLTKDPHEEMFDEIRPKLISAYTWDKEGCPVGQWPYNGVWVMPKSPLLHCGRPGQGTIAPFYWKPTLIFFPVAHFKKHYKKGRMPCINPDCSMGTECIEHKGYFLRKMVSLTGARMICKR